MSDDGLAKSAILLLSMGEEQAAEVMKYLTPKEVQKIGRTMAKLEGISRDQMDQVVSTFLDQADSKASIAVDSGAFVRSTITRALGSDKASHILDQILTSEDSSGIEGLKWMDPQSVAELIANEHPQIIASILVHLERDHASDILKNLDEAVRNEVVLRIATLDSIQPSALRELNDVLARVLSGGPHTRKQTLGGIRTAAELLNFLGAAVEASVMEAVKAHDADLAQKIVDEMFVFENLLAIDDKGIQALLREVQSEQLIVALRGASEALRDKIFKNMSQRAAEILRDDLEAKGPVRIAEVEAAQKEMIKVVRRMADEGSIALPGGGSEDAYL